MKRILVFAMAIAMCLSLSVFAEEDAYSLYAQMQEKMAGITSMEAKGAATATITIEDQTMDLTMGMVCREINLSEPDVEMELQMDMDLLGERISAAMYYKDGFMYQNMAGEKYKSVMSLEAAMAQASLMDTDFEKDMLSNATVEAVEGGKKLTFMIDAEQVNELLGDIVNSTLGGMNMDGLTMTFGDIHYSAVVDADNMLKGYDMQFSLDMTVEGVNAQVVYDINLDILSLDSISRIYYPLDMFEWKEINFV